MNETSSTRRILRSRTERILGGVAGGLADYFNVDPVLIRLAFVALTLLGGLGALLYLVAWLIVPDADDPGDPQVGTGPDGRTKPLVPVWIGVGLLALLVLAGGLRNVAFGIDGRVVWPFLLILFGAVVLWSRAGSGRSPARPGPPPGTPTEAAVIEPEGHTEPDSRAEPDGHADSGDPTPTGGPEADGDAGEDDTVPGMALAPVFAAPSSTAGAPRPAVRPSPLRRALPVLGRIVLALIGAAIACTLTVLLVLLFEGRNTLVVTPTEAVFASIAVLALAIGLGILWNRVPDLLVVALAVILVLGLAAWLRPPLRGGFGDREVVPANARAVESSYELAGGRLRLDLSAVHPAGRERTVSASVAIGQLDIVVPKNVTVRYDGRVSAGAVCVFGHEDSGTGNVVHGTVSTDVPGAVLTIHARVGAGALHFQHPGDEAWRDCNPGTPAAPATPTVPPAPTALSAPTAPTVSSVP